MFRFIVAAYKAEPWIERCLRSMQRQTVKRFRCTLVDDASPDDTYEKARSVVAGDERFHITRNEQNKGPLGNRVAMVRGQGDPEDVCIIVDGDDWLMHDRVLESVGSVYADPDVWITYGSHQRWKNKLLHRIGWTKRRGIAEAYPEAIVRERDFRAHTFLASHLRTFRQFLYDAISDEDLRDEDGAYYKFAGDVADTIPMLEMAGPEHIRFIEEMLYVYNNSNVLSEHRVDAMEQQACEARVRARPKYELLRRTAGEVT